MRGKSWLVWLLIATLGLYFASASVLRVMGPRHWHAAPLPQAELQAPGSTKSLSQLGQRIGAHVATVLARVDAFAEDVHARAHALGATAAHHTHSHSGLLRHWHAADDSTVQLAESTVADAALDDLKAAAAGGGATLLPVLADVAVWQGPAHVNGRWPAAPATAWRNAAAAPALKPPIGLPAASQIG